MELESPRFQQRGRFRIFDPALTTQVDAMEARQLLSQGIESTANRAPIHAGRFTIVDKTKAEKTVPYMMDKADRRKRLAALSAHLRKLEVEYSQTQREYEKVYNSMVSGRDDSSPKKGSNIMFRQHEEGKGVSRRRQCGKKRRKKQSRRRR